MSRIILFTADLAAMHQVKAAVGACDVSDALMLTHFADAAEGLSILTGTTPEHDRIAALLVDVTLPDGDGALLVDALRDAGLVAPLIMLHDAHVYAAQRLGEAASRKPVAMVAKTSPLPMLVAALRRALSVGEGVGVAAEVAAQAIEHDRPETVREPAIKAAAKPDSGMTPDEISWRIKRLSVREREVLALFCQGYSGKIVARKLGTELKTVFNQCTSIFEKTGVRPMRRLITLLSQAESGS